MSTAARIIKNTGFLYAKMVITVFISLYTTRLILLALGASDFGIYNVVGGAIAMMGFLNSTMANATQRFMSYSLGNGDLDNSKRIFNISIILHVAIAILTAIILLIFMWPLFSGVLDIPSSRISSAQIVYLCLVFSTIITIVNVPYDALINAHEDMRYYAIVGIFESLLRLAVAICCVYTTADKLIVYGVLMAIIPMITLLIMMFYCHKRYSECELKLRHYWDGKVATKILSFSGWNFLTAISYLFTTGGLGIVLNHFFGAILNAAQGIANQLNGYMTSVSLQLSKAVSPVIVKKAGSGNYDSLVILSVASCKFTTFLVLLFSIPCMLEMPFVLKVWLKEVPEWAVVFCIMQLIQTIICQMAASISTAIYAQGNIKWYAIYKSLMNITPLIVVYFCFLIGCGPIWLYIPMIIIWGIGGNIVVVNYGYKLCGLTVRSYMKGVVLPVLEVSGVMVALGFIPSIFIEQGVIRFLISGVLSTIGILIGLYLFGLTSYEFELFIAPLKRFIKK